MNTIQSRYEVGAKTLPEELGFEMEWFKYKGDAYLFAQSLRKQYPDKNEIEVYVFDRMAHKEKNNLYKN